MHDPMPHRNSRTSSRIPLRISFWDVLKAIAVVVVVMFLFRSGPEIADFASSARDRGNTLLQSFAAFDSRPESPALSKPVDRVAAVNPEGATLLKHTPCTTPKSRVVFYRVVPSNCD